MPVAVRLRERHACPILLDTHDLQARQYALAQSRRASGFLLLVRFEDMLEIELDAMRLADLLIHLNDEEAAAFKKLVPDKRHALLYPAVEAMPAGPGGGEPIIVASANYPNFLGLAGSCARFCRWRPMFRSQILGNIDREVQSRAPDLYKAHAAVFPRQGRGRGSS